MSIVYQGQAVTFVSSFRTTAGDAFPVYKTAGGEEGANITIKRGGSTTLSASTTSGSDGVYSFQNTFYHGQWPEGLYTLIYSGFDAEGNAISTETDLSVVKSYTFTPVDSQYYIEDLVPFLEDAIGNGPHDVTGENVFGVCNGTNKRFTLMGRHIVPGSETITRVSSSGTATALTAGAATNGYTINYDTGVLELTAAPFVGDSVLAGYSHNTYGRDQLMQAVMRACTALATRGIITVSVTNGQPSIDVDPASILGMLMLSAQIAVLEMQVQTDARRSFDFSDAGLSMKRSSIPNNERQLLRDFKEQLEEQVRAAAMDTVAAPPASDANRFFPETMISTVFELDA